MFPIVVVNRLLRNVGRQRALLPGQGGQLDGHVAELGVEWSVVEGGRREGRGEVRTRVPMKRRIFCLGAQGL